MKYDNCERAFNLFQKLLALYENRNYRKIFGDLKISKDNLTKSLNDLEMRDNNVKYSRISELFKEKRYLEAANLSAEGIEDFEKNPEVFSKIGLTKDRLLTDAGVSYLKEAEKAEKKFAPPDEIQNLLENAQEFLKEVKVPDSTTKSNINIIKKKLKKLDNL